MQPVLEAAGEYSEKWREFLGRKECYNVGSSVWIWLVARERERESRPL